jgi:hypothetical protein
MNDAKYIGLDVHQATISVAVLDSAGNLVMEAVLETKAETILQFIHGLRGSLHVTLEEGTCAAWLHDLLKPHVTQVLVCDLVGEDGFCNEITLFSLDKNPQTSDAHKLDGVVCKNRFLSHFGYTFSAHTPQCGLARAGRLQHTSPRTVGPA